MVQCYVFSSLNQTTVIVVNSEHCMCGILQYSGCFVLSSPKDQVSYPSYLLQCSGTKPMNVSHK